MGRIYPRLLLWSLLAVGALLPDAAGLRSLSGNNQAAGRWPVFRGTPLQSGVALADLPDSLAVHWKFQTKDSIESTAAIAEGTVYIGSEDGYLYALDLASGMEKWKYKAGPIAAPIAVHNGAVYFGDLDGIFHCVDAARGEKRWTFKTESEIKSGANFAGDTVLFGSGEGDENLYCLSKEGKELWRFKVAGGPILASPAVIGQRTFVAGCDSSLHVLDTAAKGKELAAVDLGSQTGATCAIMGNRLYLGTMGNQVLAIDWEKAKVVWRFDSPRNQPFFASAAVTDGLVIVGCRDKRIYALDRITGKPVWNFATERKVDSSPVVVGKRVYAASLDGNLYELDLSKGTPLHRYKLSGQGILASPAVAGNYLVLGTKEGVVYCLGAKK